MYKKLIFLIFAHYACAKIYLREHLNFSRTHCARKLVCAKIIYITLMDIIYGGLKFWKIRRIKSAEN